MKQEEVFFSKLRPAFVLIEGISCDFVISELISCGDDMKNIDEAQARKTKRYSELKEGIKKTGVGCQITPFEACALGDMPAHTRQAIRYLVGQSAA